MALWLIIMFLGLGALGYVFYKVWTAPASGIERKWLAWALAGALVSIVGLLMTIRSVQKEPSFIPRATLEPGGAGKPTIPNVGPDGAQPGGPTAPKPAVTSEQGIPKFDPNQYPEDASGPTFTKEDLDYFVNRPREILNEFDKQMTLDKQPGRNEEKAAKANRWMLFYEDWESWLANLRGRTASKNGPGTGRPRQLVYEIAENLEKMVRVYYNSTVNDEDPDMQYISDLRGTIERLQKELMKESGQ